VSHVVVIVPGIPTAWARAGRGHGTIYTAPKHRAAMAEVVLFARRAMAGKPLMVGPLEMVVTFVFPWPKSTSAKRRLMPEYELKDTKPDSSNLLKLIEDALEGIVYMNDSQISDHHVKKRYGSRPEMRVEISTLRPVNYARSALRDAA